MFLCGRSRWQSMLCSQQVQALLWRLTLHLLLALLLLQGRTITTCTGPPPRKVGPRVLQRAVARWGGSRGLGSVGDCDLGVHDTHLLMVPVSQALSLRANRHTAPSAHHLRALPSSLSAPKRGPWFPRHPAGDQAYGPHNSSDLLAPGGSVTAGSVEAANGWAPFNHKQVRFVFVRFVFALHMRAANTALATVAVRGNQLGAFQPQARGAACSPAT